MTEYLENIVEVLKKIETEEKEKLSFISKKVSEVIKNDGIIYIFGCGHSHLPGLDTFYRAGGLANVCPMLDTDLMLHNGAAKSSRMEKMKGIGTEIYRRYSPDKKDIIFLVSASGKNAVPVEVAENAKNHGVYTVGLSSSSYFEKGALLNTVVDTHIDIKVPYGDASVKVGDSKMGGLSTYASCFVLNSVLIEGSKIAAENGVDIPVFISGNIEGGREHNIGLEEKYFKRVKHL